MPAPIVDFKPDDNPNGWSQGELESKPEHHGSLSGGYHTADVRDADGELHENVTVILPERK